MTKRGKAAIDYQSRFNGLLVDGLVHTKRYPQPERAPKVFLSMLLKLMSAQIELSMQIDEEMHLYSDRERETIVSLRDSISTVVSDLSKWIERLPS